MSHTGPNRVGLHQLRRPVQVAWVLDDELPRRLVRHRQRAQRRRADTAVHRHLRVSQLGRDGEAGDRVHQGCGGGDGAGGLHLDTAGDHQQISRLPGQPGKGTSAVSSRRRSWCGGCRSRSQVCGVSHHAQVRWQPCRRRKFATRPWLMPSPWKVGPNSSLTANSIRTTPVRTRWCSNGSPGPRPASPARLRPWEARPQPRSRLVPVPPRRWPTRPGTPHAHRRPARRANQRGR